MTTGNLDPLTADEQDRFTGLVLITSGMCSVKTMHSLLKYFLDRKSNIKNEEENAKWALNAACQSPLVFRHLQSRGKASLLKHSWYY